MVVAFVNINTCFSLAWLNSTPRIYLNERLILQRDGSDLFTAQE